MSRSTYLALNFSVYYYPTLFFTIYNNNSRSRVGIGIGIGIGITPIGRLKLYVIIVWNTQWFGPLETGDSCNLSC
jgi:hypothetical protein